HRIPVHSWGIPPGGSKACESGQRNTRWHRSSQVTGRRPRLPGCRTLRLPCGSPSGRRPWGAGTIPQGVVGDRCRRISLCLSTSDRPAILAQPIGKGPTMNAQIAFDDLNATLKATGEETRLRILCLLAEAELTVSELTEILRQSQPRISRHLKLLAEAQLVERFREGSWAFFRRAEHGPAAAVAAHLVGALDPADPIVARDRERLTGVRVARGKAGQGYFLRHAGEGE